MAKHGSKVVAAAVATLLISLPSDEGGVKNGVSKPYYDIGGVLTVCYGHTGRDIDPFKIYNTEECNEFLRKDIVRHMSRVQGCLTREPSLGQLIAFTSHDFNTGAWCGSRSNREFNAGNNPESCRAISTSPTGAPAWSYVKGTYVEGLHKRRKREEAVCMKDLYAKVSMGDGAPIAVANWSLYLARPYRLQFVSEWPSSGYSGDSPYVRGFDLSGQGAS